MAMASPEPAQHPPADPLPPVPAQCTCIHPHLSVSSPPSHHLSSAILGPYPSPTSFLNEWILSHPEHVPSGHPPPPVQHLMLLPSLQLLSFLVCRPPSPPSAHYLYSDDEVTVLIRDSRGKHAWRMRGCLARRSGDQPRLPSDSPTSARARGLPPTEADDDRFMAAWQSFSSSFASPPAHPPPAPSLIERLPSSPAVAGGASPASGLSNLRNAIVSAKSSPFSSLAASASSLRQSHWKAMSQSFSLFDAVRDSDAWVAAQEATAEHSQYTRCIQQQLQQLAASHTPTLPLPQQPSLRPTAPDPEPLLDGFPQLHALLHELGFFSSLVPAASVPEALTAGGAALASPSLMLLHPSSALTAALSQLDMVEDARLCRVLVLLRRDEQLHDAQMMRNRSDAPVPPAEDGDPRELSFDAFLDQLTHTHGGAQRSQLQLFALSRLCPSLLQPSVTPESGGGALFLHLLATTSVRVVWCAEDNDGYVPPHKLRRRERRQRRQEQQQKREQDAQPRDASGSDRGASYHSPSTVSVVLPPPAPGPPAVHVALVYIVVTPQGEGSYRVRIDCDYRLRNRRRESLPVASRTLSHTSPSSRVPVPLLRGNSLTNAHTPHSGTSPASSSTMLKTLFKRLGRTGKGHGGGSNLLGVRERGRDDSLSPVRKDSGGVLSKQRSPRKERDRAGRADDPRGHADSRRRAARAILRSHPLLARPWPPEEQWLKANEVAAKVREWMDDSVARVDAWKEVKARERRRREAALRMWKAARARSGEWSGDEEHDGGDGGARVEDGLWSSSRRVQNVRDRLLRDLVREHGEMVTPAAFLAACFGSQHATQAMEA